MLSGGQVVSNDLARRIAGNLPHDLDVPRLFETRHPVFQGRLQWNSPVVMAIGWRLHRHHWGPQFLIDATNTVLDISVLDGEHFVFPGLGVVTRVRRVGGV